LEGERALALVPLSIHPEKVGLALDFLPVYQLRLLEQSNQGVHLLIRCGDGNAFQRNHDFRCGHAFGLTRQNLHNTFLNGLVLHLLGSGLAGLRGTLAVQQVDFVVQELHHFGGGGVSGSTLDGVDDGGEHFLLSHKTFSFLAFSAVDLLLLSLGASLLYHTLWGLSRGNFNFFKFSAC